NAAKSRFISHGMSPGKPGLRARCKIREASIRFFDGRQPRLTHVPPIGRSSVITADFTNSCAVSAAANAVEPDPKIKRSKLSGIGRYRCAPETKCNAWA